MNKLIERVPKIIFHGTTFRRWELMLRDHMMKPDFGSGEYDNLGSGQKEYLYFTNDPFDAARYAFRRSYIDILDMKCTTVSSLIVLALRTYNSNLRDNIEMDPQIYHRLFKEVHNDSNPNLQWYRYKGNIELGYLTIIKYVDSNTIPKKDIEYMLDFMRRLRSTLRSLDHEQRQNVTANDLENILSKSYNVLA